MELVLVQCRSYCESSSALLECSAVTEARACTRARASAQHATAQRHLCSYGQSGGLHGERWLHNRHLHTSAATALTDKAWRNVCGR